MAQLNFSPLDHVRLVLSRLLWPVYQCCPSFSRAPPSPPLTPQEGELETLLTNPGEWEDDDVLLSTPRHVKLARNRDTARKPTEPMRDDPPSYDSHSHLRPQSSTSGGGRPRPTSGISEFEGVDEDARSLNPGALEGMAKKFEPALTLEDIEREEAEQAERERRAERAGGLDIYSPPLRDEDEFGEFEQAKRSEGQGAASDIGEE